ncbi:DNA topoisomerase I, partial [Candidatus Micrarchaeota archaeon]|nr:DNA topoisomerase I [Candidatus Micrarchaeota archaeon]
MELIVAEKPKVAQKIAQALTESPKKKALGGVSYYEGERHGHKIVVAPAVGHVYSLVEKEKSNGYPVFDIEWRPAYDVDKDAEFTKPYVELLEKLGEKAKRFVSACDYDLEGSLIGYNVCRFTFAGKEKDAGRMKFSALTNRDLVEAYEDMSELDLNNAFAGEARHILDWYYGINLSRALMASVKSVNRYKVMSIGRVQGPTLSVLAQLEREIKAFVPTPYWELTVLIKDVEFKHTTGRFLDEKEAKKAHDKTKDKGMVESVEKKEQKVSTNPPFDLTSLQVEAYRVFGFAPTRTLSLAQGLYENSLISYPRTSSQKLPAKLGLTNIIKKLADHAEYKKSANELIENKWFTPLEGKKEDPAHPAIHPTGQQGKMNDSEKKLYDLIVKRFLATFAPQATKERTNILVDSNGEGYGAGGTRIVDAGWIKFYEPYYKGEDKLMPEFEKDEKVNLEKKKKSKKETEPPRRYSDASIISELEERHLGTKATRASIVQTLHDRGYIAGKSIQVSDFGLKVFDVLKKYAPEILDENLTRVIEENVEKIQEGKLNKDRVIKEGKEVLVSLLDKWKKHEKKIGEDLIEALDISREKESTVGKCDKCGNTLRIIRMRGGRQFIGCRGYPNCRNAYPLPGGAWVMTTEDVCSTCGKPVVLVKMGKRPFKMCVDPNCPTKERTNILVDSNGEGYGAGGTR